MKRTPFYSDARSYEQYYQNQAGHGLSFFSGKRHQRGRGLMSFLGRAIVPLLKSGGKALAKQGLNTGMQVAQDLLSGQNFKSSVRKRTKQAGTKLLNQALNQVATKIVPSGSLGVPPPPKAKRIKADQRMRAARSRQSRRRRGAGRSFGDIFG